VEALRSLAEIHGTHGTELGEADNVALALGTWNRRWTWSSSIGGHHEKSQLHTEIARAHEAAGDLARALAAERAARAEELKEQDRRAAEPAAARARAPRDRAPAARRVQRCARGPLESALSTLEHLRLVGQDITATSTRRGCWRRSTATSRRSPTSRSPACSCSTPRARASRATRSSAAAAAGRDVALADFESLRRAGRARAARDRATSRGRRARPRASRAPSPRAASGSARCVVKRRAARRAHGADHDARAPTASARS
jgi:hypothetical protein